MNILLLGGAGYIGSHTITAVPRALGFLALQAIRNRAATYMSEGMMMLNHKITPQIALDMGCMDFITCHILFRKNVQ